MTHEQRQLTDEHIALWREGCTLLEAMTPTEYAEGRSDRCRRFRAIHKELTWGLLDPHSASLFDARLDGPCEPAGEGTDVGPAVAADLRLVPHPAQGQTHELASHRAGNRLADFAGLETRVDRSDRSHAQKIRAVTCQQSPSHFDTARSDVGCGDDGDRASGMDASQHHVPGLD